MNEATGLQKLREPFPAHQVSKLPKPTAKRDVMDGLPKAICQVCGQYHATSKVIHLDYVGHAALTDRLLDADPAWTWEPLAISPDGLPVLDGFGGMWIKLTVCGVTRLGYGDAGDKEGGNAIKEVIGDALRNAAMRFGAALELWHKGQLHIEEETPSLEDTLKKSIEQAKAKKRRDELDDLALQMIEWHKEGKDGEAIKVWYAADTFSKAPDGTDDGTGNEERLYVWKLLKEESRLRSTIKANSPERTTA